MVRFASLLVLVSACGGDGVTLYVELKTDVRPGIEFTTVEVAVDDASGRTSSDTTPAFSADDYLSGLRVAELEVAPGATTVVVSLLDRDGRTVAARRTRVTVEGTTGITVLITSDCADVTCPLSGDAANLTECLMGRCVSPDCYVENPDACPDRACADDLSCSSGTACAAGVCLDGVCFVRPDDALCRAGEYCDPNVGCRVREPDPGDAGTDASPTCEPDSPCMTGRACEVGTTQCVDGVAVCVASGLATAGTECRPSSSECDVAETCDGTSPTCPPDDAAPTGTSCSAGICDGLGMCIACSPGAPCSTGNPCALGEIACSGTSATCEEVGPAPAGTLCRGAVDVCDAEEVCDGVSTRCPSDGFAPASTTCRGAAGPCDRPEACSGASAACPADAVQPGTFVCRASAGPCDAPETCNGASIVCPTDVLAGAGTVCRTAASACDVQESCDGTSVACPADRFAPASTVCRAASGDCDVPESCTGSSGTCPSNGFATSGECRAAAGPCDRAESCNGSGPDCPSDGFRSGNVCRSASGPCDVAESCDGSGPDCPRNEYQPNGTSCGGSWSELGCGPIPVDACMDGSCVHNGNFNTAGVPSCGGIASMCGFSPGNCCGNGDGYFCVSEPGNPIYGSSFDCSQCCRPGRCCLSGNPSGPCR